MANTTNVMIVGVGGQGTLLASRILGNLIVEAGIDVKVSEVHGMSQRGGSVVTYVKFGEKVNSPIIEKGEADVILAFEELEAGRWVEYLKKDGKLIVNSQKMMPMPVIIGTAKYPEDILDKVGAQVENLICIDALEKAQEAGNVKAVNVVLLGVLAKFTDFSKEKWIAALEKTVPAKFLEVNKKAFELGYSC